MHFRLKIPKLNNGNIKGLLTQNASLPAFVYSWLDKVNPPIVSEGGFVGRGNKEVHLQFRPIQQSRGSHLQSVFSMGFQCVRVHSVTNAFCHA